MTNQLHIAIYTRGDRKLTPKQLKRIRKHENYDRG